MRKPPTSSICTQVKNIAVVMATNGNPPRICFVSSQRRNDCRLFAAHESDCASLVRRIAGASRNAPRCQHARNTMRRRRAGSLRAREIAGIQMSLFRLRSADIFIQSDASQGGWGVSRSKLFVSGYNGAYQRVFCLISVKSR